MIGFWWNCSAGLSNYILRIQNKVSRKNNHLEENYYSSIYFLGNYKSFRCFGKRHFQEGCQFCFLNVRQKSFGKKVDLNCLISSLFRILSKKYSLFLDEIFTRIVKTAFYMFWRKKDFSIELFFSVFRSFHRRIKKVWLRLSGRVFETTIDLPNVSFWEDRFPWKQKQFYRSRISRGRASEKG